MAGEGDRREGAARAAPWRMWTAEGRRRGCGNKGRGKIQRL
nr:MAG TPA: hypothetical protein [Caudoviricetes sp.]